MSEASKEKFWIKFADEYPEGDTNVLLTDDGAAVRSGSWRFDDHGCREWDGNEDYYDGDTGEFDNPYIYGARIPALPEEEG